MPIFFPERVTYEGVHLFYEGIHVVTVFVYFLLFWYIYTT